MLQRARPRILRKDIETPTYARLPHPHPPLAMHNRPRQDESLITTEEKNQKREKIMKYNAAKTQLLQMRNSHIYTPESYHLTTKLIEINPDFYSLFNYRKEILLNMIETDVKYKDEQDNLSILITSELDLSYRALLKNPKCYGAWHHRLWLLDLTQLTHDMKQKKAQEELELCTKMLGMDARNFHCWNYRRAVAARAKALPEDEFKYTTTKINENFSNYSAWHYRTVLIPRMYSHEWFNSTPSSSTSRHDEYHTFLDSEFELVKQAFYTEPEDQSAWLYHRWLLGRIVATGSFKLPVLGISLGTHLADDGKSGTDEKTKELEQAATSSSFSQPASSSLHDDSLSHHLTVFTREHTSVQELLEIEPSCKWALLTSSILQAGIVACLNVKKQQSSSSSQEQEQQILTHTTDIKSKFDLLLKLDPMRTNYYKEVREGFLAAEKQA